MSLHFFNLWGGEGGGVTLFFSLVCVCWNIIFVLNIHSLIHTIFVYCGDVQVLDGLVFLFWGNNM